MAADIQPGRMSVAPEKKTPASVSAKMMASGRISGHWTTVRVQSPPLSVTLNLWPSGLIRPAATGLHDLVGAEDLTDVLQDRQHHAARHPAQCRQCQDIVWTEIFQDAGARGIHRRDAGAPVEQRHQQAGEPEHVALFLQAQGDQEILGDAVGREAADRFQGGPAHHRRSAAAKGNAPSIARRLDVIEEEALLVGIGLVEAEIEQSTTELCGNGFRCRLEDCRGLRGT